MTPLAVVYRLSQFQINVLAAAANATQASEHFFKKRVYLLESACECIAMTEISNVFIQAFGLVHLPSGNADVTHDDPPKKSICVL